MTLAGTVKRRKSKRRKIHLDVGEVAHLLSHSDNWVRARYAAGMLDGFRGDDGIRKITVASVRSYMLQHGIDTASLDEYLESHS